MYLMLQVWKILSLQLSNLNFNEDWDVSNFQNMNGMFFSYSVQSTTKFGILRVLILHPIFFVVLTLINH